MIEGPSCIYRDTVFRQSNDVSGAMASNRLFSINFKVPNVAFVGAARRPAFPRFWTEHPEGTPQRRRANNLPELRLEESQFRRELWLRYSGK